VKVRLIFSIFLLSAFCTIAAQDNQAPANNNSGVSTAGVNLIARTTQAEDYRRGATTGVDFKGTDLMPEVTGKAKIISKKGLVDVHVDLENLKPAKNVDVAYLTYVLWAISPEGNAKNIGELIEKDGNASLHTTTQLQAFALVITAEPDFAVSQPSELVVAENSIRPTTEGRPESVDVHYEVFPRSYYVSQVGTVQNDIYAGGTNAPLDLLEARNAVRIARDAHAEQYAPDILKHAEMLLNEAEDYYRGHQNKKTVGTVAREAAQTAEEARVTAVRSEEHARLDRERQENRERAEQAEKQAEQANQQADQAQRQADQANQQASQAQEQAQAEAQQRAAAEQQSQQAAQEAEQARQQAQAEADRRRQLEEQQQTAQQQSQQAQDQAAQAQQQAQQAQEQAQTEAQQRASAEQQQQQAAQQADEARRQAEQAQQRAQQSESNQAQLRQRLIAQLNEILATRDSARGLIVSMPDVLFDTGSANLKPTARERLAKVAGILLAYPDMRIEVDGYTDSTGNPMSNEQLSQERAASVQSYMTQQGVSAAAISIHGFGEANPVASNESMEGRQQNRRVELVVSGESIGTAQLTH
jgi:outer membrane protein OmpA-like peptidoglycan-associated protein